MGVRWRRAQRHLPGPPTHPAPTPPHHPTTHARGPTRARRRRRGHRGQRTGAPGNACGVRPPRPEARGAAGGGRQNPGRRCAAAAGGGRRGRIRVADQRGRRVVHTADPGASDEHQAARQGRAAPAERRAAAAHLRPGLWRQERRHHRRHGRDPAGHQRRPRGPTGGRDPLPSRGVPRDPVAAGVRPRRGGRHLLGRADGLL